MVVVVVEVLRGEESQSIEPVEKRSMEVVPRRNWDTGPIRSLANVVKWELRMITSVAFDMRCKSADCSDCIL